MPQWSEKQRLEINGVTLIVEERTDRRNRQGATEYIVNTEINGTPVHQERISQSTWLGHNHGNLLLPEIAQRARTKHTA